MKKMNIVRNTNAEGTETYRERSRIGSINHRIWSVIAPMLFIAFGLFGVNVNVWATWPTYSGSCSTSGYVLYDQSCELNTIDSEEFPLAGPGAIVSFEAKHTLAGAGDMYIAQYVDGEWSSSLWNGNPGEEVKEKKGWPISFWVTTGWNYKSYTVSAALDPRATKIKFYTQSGATLFKNVQKIRVTRASGNAYALYNDNLDCGSANYNAANSSSNYTTGTAYVDWSHIATQPTCSITGSHKDYFEIQTKSNTPKNNSYGAMSIQVAYKHTAPGDHSATLNVGGKTITIKGHTNKITPYIVTTPTVDIITYGQTISNSQLGDGLVKADLINAAGTVVPGTWTIDENGQAVTTSGGSNATVNLTFTPTDGDTYNVIHTKQSMFVRSVATISWASAYSAEEPTVPVGKWIENAATTNAAGAVITYSSTSSNVEISADGHSFRFTAEDEAEVVASHGVTATHGSASETKTFKSTYKAIQVIVWPDRFDRLTTEMTTKPLIAEVWIEDPTTGDRTYSSARTALLEYSSNNSNVVSVSATTLTIEGKGTTTLRAYVQGNDQYEEASLTMPVKVREPSEGCEDPLLLNKPNDGTNDYLYRLFSMSASKPELYSDEYKINIAQGQVPGKLSFGHKGEEFKLVGSWAYYSGSIKAQQKVNGQWIDVPNSSVTPTKGEWKEIEGLQLDEKATHIRIVRPKGGEGYHYVRNVEVTMKHFIRTETPEVDFGNTIKVNSSEFKDVTIHYSNVKDALSVTNPFESDVTTDDDIEVDSCGAFGDAKLRITYSPTTAGPINDVIVVKDPILKTTCDIRVKADVQRADQTIKWNPDTELLATETIELNGTTNGKEHGVMNAITYTVTNNDGVISVTNNVVTILKPGTVTITATQNGSTNYGTADPVEKNFTILAETLTVVEAPTASDITYGQTLIASTLTGGSVQDSKGNTVAGSFSWQTATTAPNAGDNQNFTVVFTPEENAAWYNTLTTSVAVNVEKADATLSWTSAPESVEYGATDVVYAASSVSDGAITYSIIAGSDCASIESESGALTIKKAGSFTVQASQAASTNHNAPEAITKDVTVNKITPILTWTVAPTELAYNATDVVYTASSASNGAITYSIIAGDDCASIESESGALTIKKAGSFTVQASQAAGTNHNAPEAITKDVTVNKITPTLTWTVAPTELAYNATGVVYEASSTSSEGAITYSIVSGIEYAEIDAQTGELTILVPGQTVTVQAAQTEGTNYLAPEAITINVTIGAAPLVNIFTNTAKNGDWDDSANWSNGVPSSEPDIIVTGALEINKDIIVHNLTIESTGSVAVISGGTLTVKGTSEDRTEYGDVHVMSDGALALGSSADLQVRDFTLDAKLAGKNNSDVKEAAASGQVENQNKMTINGDAYFQMTFDPKGKISFGWYDFVVPFPVNVLDGIFRAGDLSNHLVSGVDFLIREYSESRCSNKQNAWTNFSGTMQPGRVYTVTFNYDPNFDQNVFVFKNASSVIGASETFATQYSEGSGDTDDYGWNGLGNGMLQHGYITGSFAHMQVYNHAENKYDLLTGKNPTFAIGTSFFVQVDHTKPTMTWHAAAANEDHPLYAPKRDNFEVEEFMLSLRNEDQVDASDHFFISASEEATEAYVIGRDLRKMGTPTAAKAAQMWATKGGKTLCDIETRMENDQASSDLNFFAPEAQTYTLSVEESPEDATLYLTYNDRIIWSLSASPYTINLEKGTTEGYGLRIVARHHSPSVATGMDELNVDQDANRKVLIDNMLYIITPEGAMYSVTGEKVK